MILTLATTLLLASFVVASPITEPGYCRPSQKTYIANYDDLPFTDPGPNPIGTYQGLTYNIFQVDQYDFFIPPSSGDKWAMAFGGSGNISDDQPRSTFALHSFSFACDSGVPQPECAITIYGYRSTGSNLKRVIKYPRLDSGHPVEDYIMNATTFGREWSNLRSVGFSIARADNGGDMYGGLGLDDVKYTISSKC